MARSTANTSKPKVPCRFCGRQIVPFRFTHYPRPHKWTLAQHNETFPGKPFIDGWCPGGQGH